MNELRHLTEFQVNKVINYFNRNEQEEQFISE